MPYKYRRAGAADKEAIYNIYSSVMRQFISDIWGWDEAWQRDDFEKYYIPANITVIEGGAEIIGYAQVEEKDAEWFIRMLAVLPDHRLKGIGTEIIQELIRSKRRKGKQLRLEVFRINSAAQSFYKRLGFRAVDEDANSLVFEFQDEG